MRVYIEKSIPEGEVKAPPSKSIAHRLILLAALSEGTSVISNVSLSDDIKATLNCIRAIGADWEYADCAVSVRGVSPDKIRINEILNCCESGSTLRFFIPVCMLSGVESVLIGSKKLLSRPLGVYEEIAKEQGIFFSNDGEKVTVSGKLRAGLFKVPGDISSQFISGLLFVLPLLRGDSTLEITGEIQSRSYIDLTLDALYKFGAEIQWLSDHTLFIKGGQKYRAVNTSVEGDLSNAAFFYAMQYLSVPSGLKIEGVNQITLQGDSVCIPYFEKLTEKESVLDISDCPDLGPILMAFAALKNGVKLTGTKRLQMKESNRGEAMARELSKFGVKTCVFEDSVVVCPGAVHQPTEVLCGHNDHRIVMSLAFLCLFTGGVIEGAEAVNKSFPDFFEKLMKLKVKLYYET